MEVEVIIIGAGPTGLMAACQLQRFGIEFIIADTKSQPTEESRAMILTARSMEIYQQMGLAEDMLKRGVSVKELSIFVGGKKKLDFSIGEGGVGLTDFPYTFSFEQSANEKILYQTLKTKVLWNTTFVSLEQGKDNVAVLLKNTGGKEDELNIQARYLIACDGSGSSVRKFLKCKFEGKTYKNKFFVTDTKISWDLPYNRLITAPTKAGLCTFFPMNDDRHYRISGTLPKSYHDHESIPFKDLEEVIRSTTQIPVKIEQINWFSTYRLHHRNVENLRIGRCFLAGDAAHIHSPAGGQGMNNGLQEAYNLSWKLAMVLKGDAGDRLLDTYHEERYPFAMWLMKYSNKIFELTTSENKIISFSRLHIISMIMKLVPNRILLTPKAFKQSAQIWYSYRKSQLSVHRTNQRLRFRAGDRFPYVMIQDQSCYHLLTKAKFHLVIINQKDSGLRQNILPDTLKHQVKPVFLSLSEEWKKLGVTGTLYILVRPDNYIAMLSDDLEKDSISDYFNTLSFTE